VHNLCKPGFCITENSVAEITGLIEDLGRDLQLSDCTVILQLYDNSVYQVGGPGGVRHLPTCDRQGRYHIDGTLQVADKSAIKEMTALLSPLSRRWDRRARLSWLRLRAIGSDRAATTLITI
jgi:hypothetical protein